MSQASVKVQPTVAHTSTRNPWRTATLLLLVVALAGVGYILWQSGTLAGLLGNSVAPTAPQAMESAFAGNTSTGAAFPAAAAALPAAAVDQTAAMATDLTASSAAADTAAAVAGTTAMTATTGAADGERRTPPAGGMAPPAGMEGMAPPAGMEGMAPPEGMEGMAPPAGMAAADGAASAATDAATDAAASASTDAAAAVLVAAPAAVPALAAAGQSAEPAAAAATSAAVAAADTASAAPAVAVASLPALARRSGVQLWAADGASSTPLKAGNSLRAVGRSADGLWLAVTADGANGWILAEKLIVYGADGLPEAALPAVLAAGEPAAAPSATTLATTDAAAQAATAAVTTDANAAAGSEASTAEASVAGTSAAASSAAGGLAATVTTDGKRLNVRASAAADAPVIAKAGAGASYTVIARNEAGDWLLLAQDAQTLGWASAAWLQVEGAVESLPVSTQSVDAPAISSEGAAGATADNSATPLTETPAAVAGVSVSSAATSAAAAEAAAEAAAGGLTGTIVFQQSPGGMIYAYELESGALRALTAGFDPAVSPDGSQVAFVRVGGEAGLYLINSDGSNERVIFDERGSLSSPKWNADGSAILFARNDEYIECYQVSPNECLIESVALQRVPENMLEGMPMVKEYQWRLSVVDLNGNNFHDLPALNSARTPDWSSAGVIYQSSVGIQHTDDSEGASSVEVAYERLGPIWQDPDVSPDGSRIVYQVRGAAQWDLWIMNADGSGRRGLTQPATTLVESLPSNVAAAWSPDGAHIVFLSNRTDENTAGDWRLWVMDADGSNQRALPIDVPIEYTFGAEQAVSWGG